MKKKPRKKERNKQNDDTKLKILMPVLKQKKRFILIKVITNSEENFSFEDLSREINQGLIRLLGLIDFGKGGIWILKERFNYKEQILVLRTSTKLKDKTIVALSLINEIKGFPISLKILNVSGTLKSLFKK